MYIRENSYIKEFLDLIQDHTNNNLHSLASMEIAINFGTETQKEEMHEIMQDIPISSISTTARKYLVKDMLNNIPKSLRAEISKRL